MHKAVWACALRATSCFRCSRWSVPSGLQHPRVLPTGPSLHSQWPQQVVRHCASCFKPSGQCHLLPGVTCSLGRGRPACLVVSLDLHPSARDLPGICVCVSCWRLAGRGSLRGLSCEYRKARSWGRAFMSSEIEVLHLSSLELSDIVLPIAIYAGKPVSLPSLHTGVLGPSQATLLAFFFSHSRWTQPPSCP